MSLYGTPSMLPGRGRLPEVWLDEVDIAGAREVGELGCRRAIEVSAVTLATGVD